MEERNYIVYKHTSPSNKVYIGITKQKPYKRWKYGYGYDDSQPLIKKAIQKYGWNNIRHEILYNNLTKKEAEQKEIELIAFYKSNQKEYGYNIQSGGISGENTSEETKKKMSISKLGDKNPMYGKCNYIICLETKEIYHGSKDAQKKTGINERCIRKVCKKQYGRKTAGGYHWQYLEEYNGNN